jgi:uncharacterized membrane protein YfcA
MELLSLGLGFGIGLTLGLLGGGGSILTVPALVYLVGQTPQVAVTASLAIVGANSALGAFVHRSQGTLDWRVAMLFGGSGMAAAYGAAGVSRLFSPAALMVAFAALMLVIGGLMLRRRTRAAAEAPANAARIVASGAGVGLVTGVLGVGGGFLIVPALVMLVGLPIQHAVGTSLVVIAMNSAAAFLGHLGSVTLDARVLALFVASGLVGTFGGARLARRMPVDTLRRSFALVVITLALFLLSDNVPKLP